MFIHTRLQSFDFSTKLHMLGEIFNVRFDNAKDFEKSTDNFKIRNQKGVF
jgi:hypothetical protein